MWSSTFVPICCTMPTCGLSAKVDPEQFQSHSIFRLCSLVLTKREEEAGLLAGSC